MRPEPMVTHHPCRSSTCSGGVGDLLRGRYCSLYCPIRRRLLIRSDSGRESQLLAESLSSCIDFVGQVVHPKRVRESITIRETMRALYFILGKES